MPSSGSSTDDATEEIHNSAVINPSAASEEKESEGDQLISASQRRISTLLSSRNINDLCTPKQRSVASTEVGATQVDEVAPNLNLRFFLHSSRQRHHGTSRHNDARDSNHNSQIGTSNHSNHASHMTTSRLRSMNNIMLEAADEISATVRRASSMFRSSLSGSGFSRNTQESSPTSSNNEHRRRSSSFFQRRSDSNQDSNILINATLVEPMEVAEAEVVGFCQEHAKAIGSISAIMLVAFITLMTLTLKGVIVLRRTAIPTSAPSSMPSMAPSFDPSPTLAIVQDRQKLRCGLHEGRSPGTFRYQLCQAIAAVVLNNPDSVEIVHVTADTRFVALNERTVDVLSGGETYTIEREVNEVTTGASFTFSAPYYYDGMAFAGNQTFVACAEEIKRYDECARMKICVTGKTTDYGYVASHFTVDFFIVTLSLEESIHSYLNETCNVIGSSRLDLLNYKRQNLRTLTTFIISNETFTNDPLSYVTRPEDSEWSNIANWVVQALFDGERQGITRDESLCENNADLSSDWRQLNFLNAVYCVGNYGEIYASSQLADYTRTAINTINNGTPMLYVIPYGNLDNTNEMFYSTSKTFANVKSRNMLNCGLLIRDGYSEDVLASNGLFGMGVSFCQTLASSMLDGNLHGANYTTFNDIESAFLALNDEYVDVLLGLTADITRNFGDQSVDGVVFSATYYYGNQSDSSPDVAFYPVMTRQDDKMFSAFVNCIVLSTFFAVSEGIDEEDSYKMPLMSSFGNDMLWALRDATSANGNYDQIYLKNFNVSDDSRGRNALNSKKGPQLLDMPGLHYEGFDSGTFL